MGCDIHMYAEVRRDGRWEKVGAVFENRWRERCPEDFGHQDETTDQPYEERDYALFAVLADVRNHGPIPFVPIADSRGLPDDLSPEMQREWDELGDHTPSWFTLAELQAYDWAAWRRQAHEMGWTYREMEKDVWINETLPSLAALGPPEDVRVVFWFDS